MPFYAEVKVAKKTTVIALRKKYSKGARLGHGIRGTLHGGAVVAATAFIAKIICFI